jgi:hypothetical protein
MVFCGASSGGGRDERQDHLERAGGCAEIAGKLSGKDKTALIVMVHIWLELAHETAKDEVRSYSEPPRPFQ